MCNSAGPENNKKRAEPMGIRLHQLLVIRKAEVDLKQIKVCTDPTTLG